MLAAVLEEAAHAVLRGLEPRRHAGPDERRFLQRHEAEVDAGGALVGALGLILETLLGATPPVLDRDYMDRNGLT